MLLRCAAEEGRKAAQPARGSRDGMPPLEELPWIPCCDRSCGRNVSVPCYKYWWEQISTADSNDARRHVLARLLWDVAAGGVTPLCSSRLYAWLRVRRGEVARVLRALSEAAGGKPECQRLRGWGWHVLAPYSP